MKFPRFIDIMFLVMSVAFIFTLGELRLSKEQIKDKDCIINQLRLQK